MPGRNIFFAICLFCGLYCGIGCSDKESPIVEKKFAGMQLNAFTVNPYRFRVTMNNDYVITDSLITPEGQVAKEVFFDEYSQRIRVYNTADETLMIDTPYTLGVAKTNAFTIYQTQSGTAPFYLAPSPAEPKPKANNVKISIIPTGTRLSDSVKLVAISQDVRVDSVRLKKDTFSKYFEVAADKSSRIKFYRIPNNDELGEAVFRANQFSDEFVIYRLGYLGSTQLDAIKLY